MSQAKTLEELGKETDYVGFIKNIDLRNATEKSAEKRFVEFSERKKTSSLTVDTIKNLCHGKYLTFWKGMNFMKDPLDATIYQQLIWYEKPRAIFEIGAYTGACAVWMADTARSYGIDCHVYSMDINLDMVDQAAKQDPNVTFIEGDSNLIEKAFPPEMLEKIPHPWVVAEDAHVNVVGVLQYFDNFMIEGDYFIIDDTSPESPLISGQGLFEDKGWECFGSTKLDQLEQFLESRKNKYKIDSFYTDFYGYNGTFNWNGYIRKTNL